MKNTVRREKAEPVKTFKVLRDEKNLPVFFLDDVEIPARSMISFSVEAEGSNHPVVGLKFFVEQVTLDDYISASTALREENAAPVGTDAADSDEDQTVVPEGDYHFTVMDVQQMKFKGGANLPPCNKLALKLNLTSAWTADEEHPAASRVMTANLYLHPKCKDTVSQFFASIGQREKAENFLSVDCAAVVGASGTCSVKIRDRLDIDKVRHIENEVKAFYAPDSHPVS
ncbi:MAG: hypothetical protein IJT94_16310 [Oscillibacter sp.]|nr:hypothetical protein [Oscillibacter sp.]